MHKKQRHLNGNRIRYGDLMSEDLTYSDFFQFGDQLLLDIKFDVSQLMSDLEQFNDVWFQYNEFKPYITRQGLCVLNEDGINKSWICY